MRSLLIYPYYPIHQNIR